MREVLFAALCALVTTCNLSLAAGINLYVSPFGSDLSFGDNPAHPVETIQAAMNVARSLRRDGQVNGPITIIVADGTYYAAHPLVFTPEDSGTESSPLVIKGTGMMRCVISGGMELPEFSQAGPGLWTIDLSTTLIAGGDIQQLYIDGKRAILARTPNEGTYYKGGKAVETVLNDSQTGNGLSAVQYKISADALNDLKDAVQNPGNLRLVCYHKWDVTKRTVWSVSEKDASVFVVGSKQKSWNTMDSESQYMFENDMSFLDQPGEWFYDSKERKLYYKPREGEDINIVRAVIPIASNVIQFRGNESQRVSNIKIEGLSVRYSENSIDWRGKDPMQASFGTEAAIVADYASNITIEDCEISQTGNNGVWFRKSCSGCTLKQSYIHDIGIGGVKIGEFRTPNQSTAGLTDRITVDNNIIREGGKVDACGVGVTLFNASDCSITHNDISDFSYSGVSVGWRWGYDYSPSKRNKILYNHIHHIGWGLLSDMGGVYTLGPSEGTEVSNNIIHDVYAYTYGGWGLYTDEGSTGITMSNNIVYNCKTGGFHQHYGKDNVITNNIFVNSLHDQLVASRVEDHNSFTFSNNIVCYTGGQMYGNNWEKVKSVVTKNIYWHIGGATTFNGKTLKEWQTSTGKDKGSVVADPMFKNPASGDFTVKNTKVIYKTGFKPISTDKVGVYGSTDWKIQARMDKAVEERFKAVVSAMEKAASK